MTAFRQAHPSIRRSRLWRHDVHWYGVGPSVDRSHGSHSVASPLSGASQGRAGLYVMVNAYWKPLEFLVEEGRASEWRRIVDTGQDSPDDIREKAGASLTSLRYAAQAR